MGSTQRAWSKLRPGEEQDAAHKSANGKFFLISEGMFLSGKWTWPGREEGCRCVSKSMIAGFDGYEGSKPRGFVE
jgi:hypothetical protein